MVSLWILLLLSNVNIAAALDLETRVQRVQELTNKQQELSEQLKVEFSAITHEVSTLTTSASDLQNKENILKAKNEQLDANVKQLEQDKKKLDDKVTTLTTSVSDLQKDEQNLKEKNKQRDTEVKQLEEEKKRLNDEVTAAEKTSKILKDENSKAREHNQKLKDEDKELIQEIIFSHGQSQNNIISVLIASIIMSASLNVKQYMKAKSEEGEGQEKKTKRKDDLSLFSDDEEDNGEESASVNQPGFEEDKENVQRRSEEANSKTQLKFAKEKIRNMTKVVEYLENLKQEFTLTLDLYIEWQNMTVGESRKWDLWHLSEDDLLVVTRISMERTVNEEMLPAVTVSLKQGKGSVPPAFIHTLRKTKKKTRALNPPIVQRAFGSLDSWTGE